MASSSSAKSGTERAMGPVTARKSNRDPLPSVLRGTRPARVAVFELLVVR